MSSDGDRMMHRCRSARARAIQLNVSLASLALAVYLTGCSQQPQVLGKTDQATVVKNSQALVPMPPWPEGDEQGMANTLGAGTLMRCAYHLNQPNARVYELSHLRSKQMPSSPWAEPMEYEYSSTAIIPNSIIVHHPGAKVTGVSGAQGTQMDAFAHFGYLDEIWGGQGDIPIEKAKYYGGYTQAEVKPSPDLPMQKLGIDKASPIITSALLLDAKTYLGQGKPMNAGQEIHSKDLEAMVAAQGLEWRGILPGDVLYIYTGWSDYWEKDFYYHGGPGLSLDAAKYLEKKRVVLVALDNPFTDAVNLGQFSGKAKPPVGTPDEIAGAPAHYYNLTQSGIHQIQNASLAQMAADRVWTSCTVVLPVKVKGAAGAPVSPVAVGAPDE
jgi:kynurenine formamidase